MSDDYTGDQFSEATDRVSDQLAGISNTEVGHFEIDLEESIPENEESNQETSEEEEPDTQTRTRRLLFVEESVGPDYVVIADEGNRFFRLQAQYQFWQDVAGYLSSDEIDRFSPDEIPEYHPLQNRITDPSELDPDVRTALAASLEALNQITDDERRELILQLTDIFADSGLKHSVDSVEQGSGIAGFHVYHKIFPYEDEFSIGDLNQIVERVRMAAHHGEMLLKYVFNMPIDMSGTTGGEFLDSNLPPSKSNKLDDLVDTTFSGN